MNKPARKTTGFKPVQILGGSFLALILVGTAFLMLPECHTTGSNISLLDAFFTSTSAVCVTGLIVVDTSTAWTKLGQTVILILLQLGGIGIISFGALFAIFLGRKISFHERALIKEQYGDFSVVNIFQLIPVVAVSTLAIELAGAICLYPFFIRDYGAGEAAYHSIFHSISAFCNAGFSTFSNSLENFRGNTGVNFIISFLIIVGGIGFPVLTELIGRRGPRRQLSLHTRVVLRTTGLLIILGAVVIFLMETALNEGFKE
ncbi:MAG: potassium transporter TrkG, partial [bacterium]